MTEISIWCYPWDVYDIGSQIAAAQLTNAGVDTVSLATSYHAGRFLQPGNPRRRIFFPQDGTVYYRPDPALWAKHEIRPLMADIVQTEGDMLARLVKARGAGGLAVSCWTVCLHNTRLGMKHPGHVMRTAHGDPHFYALCPSSPAARAYVVSMVAEITSRYRPDRVELESPDFMGFAHGYHHEKDGVGLLPEDAFLLGICFCDHCRARATAVGVDADAARHTVVELLDEAFSRELPARRFKDFPAQGIAAFAALPDLHDYLAWRSEPVTSLVAEIRAAADPASRVLLIDAEGSWQGGVDVAAAGRACDGVLLCAYTTPAEQIAPLLDRYRALIGPERDLIAGFQVFHPEVADAADLAARAAAAGGRADGLNFYNLGLIPPARLGWIAEAIKSFRPR